MREIPITSKFLDGTDLCEETDLRRFDQISLGSSVVVACVEVAVEGRDVPGMEEEAVKEDIVCLSPSAIIYTRDDQLVAVSGASCRFLKVGPVAIKIA